MNRVSGSAGFFGVTGAPVVLDKAGGGTRAGAGESRK